MHESDTILRGFNYQLIRYRARQSCECIHHLQDIFYIFILMGWDWVHLVLRPLFGLLYQPQMVDDECVAVGRIWIGKGNRSTRRKTAPVPLCRPQIPHDLTRARTRDAAVGIRRLTAWAIARPADKSREEVKMLAMLEAVGWGRGRGTPIFWITVELCTAGR
jgi:hypothetical protein